MEETGFRRDCGRHSTGQLRVRHSCPSLQIPGPDRGYGSGPDICIGIIRKYLSTYPYRYTCRNSSA